MDGIYKKSEEYNPNKNQKILILFDDVTADMLSNNKSNPIVTESFIRGRKQNICLVFFTQSYFAVPKIVRLNSIHYFVMKFVNKRELQQISFNHSWDIEFHTLWIFIKIVLQKINFFGYWYDSCIRKFFTFQKESFRKNIKTNKKMKTTERPTLPSGKICKYEYLTGKQTLPSDQDRIIEQTKFTYSVLSKAF